jgi:hypothetical protein
MFRGELHSWKRRVRHSDAKPEALGVRRLDLILIHKSGRMSEALKARNSIAQGGGCAAAGTLGNREMRNRVLKGRHRKTCFA